MPEEKVQIADAEMARIGDRFWQVLDLWKFVQGLELDLSQIKELMSSLWAIGQADGLRAQIVAGLSAMKLMSSMTATEIDDKIVAAIDRFSEPLLDLLEIIVEHYLPGGQAYVLNAETQQQFETAGIPWSLIITIAKFLAQLIGALKK